MGRLSRTAGVAATVWSLVASLVGSIGGSAPPTPDPVGAAADDPVTVRVMRAATDAGAGVTASHYVVSTGDRESPGDQGYRLGCADGRVGVSGPRILFFGTQEDSGGIRPPGTTRSSPVARVSPQWVERTAAGWVRGFAACGRASAALALGVNNKADGRTDPARAGADWAALVDRVSTAAPAGRVTVGGAMDGEPAWGIPSWSHRWVGAFTGHTRHTLYTADSADGCPADGPGQACSNGWTVADVFAVAGGAAPTVVAIPQIYRTDGIQARQWARISAWGAQAGKGPLRLVGALSQRAACRSQSGCGRTDNAPADAVAQLTRSLNTDPRTRPGAPLVATDMDWPVPPPPPSRP